MSHEADFKRLLLSLPELPVCDGCGRPVNENLVRSHSAEMKLDEEGVTVSRHTDSEVCVTCVLKAIGGSFGKLVPYDHVR